MGGGSGSTTSESKADPWSGQQPYLKDLMKRAKDASQDPMEYYPGQTYVDPSAETEAALQAQTQRAIGGSPLTGASQQELTKTLQGDYLDAGNPYFSQMADRVRGEVQPGIDARFAASGRLGSGAATRALGLGLGDAIGGLAYQSFGDERQKMMQAALMAPTAAQQDYFDIAKLAEVGGIREDIGQQELSDLVARHEQQQMEPWDRLGLYQSLINGNFGGNTSINQNQPKRSLGAGMLGGAATGAATGAMVGGPYGALVGGGLGLLSGAFG